MNEEKMKTARQLFGRKETEHKEERDAVPFSIVKLLNDPAAQYMLEHELKGMTSY